MKHMLGNTWIAFLLFILMLIAAVLVGLRVTSQAQEVESQAKENLVSGDNTNANWESKKYELEKRKVEIEAQKLSDARFAAKLTALSIIIPVVFGFAAIYLQGRTICKLHELQSDVAFQLKAAEVVMDSKSTKAGEERAKVLSKLFGTYLPPLFSQVFKENFKLPGTAYQEKKLELFRLLAGNLQERKEIFQIYGMLYADEDIVITEFLDKWKKAYPEDQAWAKEFEEKWKKAYPKGKWSKV